MANEFAAAEPPAANMYPQPEFYGRERAPQRSRPLSALLILVPRRVEPLPQEARPSPQLSPRKRRAVRGLEVGCTRPPGSTESATVARTAFERRAPLRPSGARERGEGWGEGLLASS